jgi:hypothetical protein
MSNFSFAEDYFFSKENKFIITIIGKNIIGNGLFSASVFKDNVLVWKENFSFLNISFSKKTFEIEEESKKEYKIVISRGRGCKGKILIDSISVINEEAKKIENISSITEVDLGSQPEDEPIFTPEENKVDTIIKKEASIIEKKETSIEKKETSIDKKQLKIIRKKRVKENSQKENIKEKIEDKNEDNLFEKKDIPIKKIRNNTAVCVMDFSIITDERDVFKYINQISFGKGKYIFLIKNNENLDFNISSYDHAKLFSSNDLLIDELKIINPNKLVFDLNDLGHDLLEIVKKIKDEL